MWDWIAWAAVIGFFGYYAWRGYSDPKPYKKDPRDEHIDRYIG
jgi:hypothetical protein